VRLGRLEVLQKIEIWLSVGPHGHQLTIEHSVGGKIVERFGYAVELMIQHVLSAGVKCRLPASAHNLDSVSVELDLLCDARNYVAQRDAVLASKVHGLS
jgi:hypothetical protein